MSNICIEEIREALVEAKDECSEVTSKADDLKGAANDVESYADAVDSAAYEAHEKVENAINMLDGLKEDQEEAIDPEEVKVFLKLQLTQINDAINNLIHIRDRLRAEAGDWGIKLNEEDPHA